MLSVVCIYVFFIYEDYHMINKRRLLTPRQQTYLRNVERYVRDDVKQQRFSHILGKFMHQHNFG